MKNNLPLLIVLVVVVISMPLFLFVTLTQQTSTSTKAFIPPSTTYNKIAKLRVTEIGTIFKKDGVGFSPSNSIAQKSTSNVLGVEVAKAPALTINELKINTQVFDQLKPTDADNLFSNNGGKLKLYKVVIPDLSGYQDAEIRFTSCTKNRVENCQSFNSFTERMYLFNSSYQPIINNYGQWVNLDTRLELKKDNKDALKFTMPSDNTILIYVGSEGKPKTELPVNFLVGFYTNPGESGFYLKKSDNLIFPVEMKTSLTTCFAGKICQPQPVLDLNQFVNKKVFVEGVFTQYYTETCSGNPLQCTNDMKPWYPFDNGRELTIDSIKYANLINQNFQITSKLLNVENKYNGENVYQIGTLKLTPTPTVVCIQAPCVVPGYEAPFFVRSSNQDLSNIVGTNVTLQGALYQIEKDTFIDLSSSNITPGVVKKLSFETLKKGNPLTGYKNSTSGEIKDTKELSRIWKLFFPESNSTPSINFTDKMVYFATTGEVPHGGFNIAFNEIIEYSDKIIANYTIAEQTCNPNTTALHYPYQFITLKRVNKPVTFIPTKIYSNCPPPSVSPTLTTTPSVVPGNLASIYFTPDSINTTVNNTFTTNLAISTNNLSVTGVEANISFSPKLMRVDSVKVQPALPNILKKTTIDNANGKITISLGSEINKPLNSGNTGVALAIINATAIEKTTKTTAMKFNSAAASALGQSNNVIGATGMLELSTNALTYIPGDIDKNGVVNIFDYNILLQNFGKKDCGNLADIAPVDKPDCKVDIFDYNTLLENFGKQPPATCGISNCHGLEVTCGSQATLNCTEQYQLGDRCRKFVRCETTNNQCSLVQDTAFTQCKSCVQNCQTQFASNNEALFACEAQCGN